MGALALSASWRWNSTGPFRVVYHHYDISLRILVAVDGLSPGACLNIMIPSYQYRNSHCKDETVSKSHTQKDGLYIETGPAIRIGPLLCTKTISDDRVHWPVKLEVLPLISIIWRLEQLQCVSKSSICWCVHQLICDSGIIYPTHKGITGTPQGFHGASIHRQLNC